MLATRAVARAGPILGIIKERVLVSQDGAIARTRHFSCLTAHTMMINAASRNVIGADPWRG
jgi:hypothetical protein